MPSLAYDLGFMKTGIEQLQNYLLSQDLFWPLGSAAPVGEGSYPHLTLGGLLLARARSHARVSSPDQRAELARLDRQQDAVRSRWRAAWGRKATHEFHSRLNQWRNYLEEYRQNPDAHVAYYPQEVKLRVMMCLLKPEAENLPDAEILLLDAMDALLRTVFVRGAFVWEAELRSAFPQEKHWYLYGRPRDFR